ncbi:MAG: carboxypeptidase regulatory-like domain-containing protein [Micrococcales bacterium]|nr:carboxypeptidase regulatory-like domain-containing protein [Micrococcales bacterium]
MRTRAVLASLILAVTAVAAGTMAADAAPRQRSTTWSTAAVPPATITTTPGFPVGSIVSTDPALGVSAGVVQTGSTPPGQVYGTSSGSVPLALHSGAGSTSTTVTFASPTPGARWSFVLSDVDAETLVLSATGPGGPVDLGSLGYQGSYNSAPGGGDQPVWNPATGELRGNVADTAGASAWFSPTAPISTLTLTSTRISATGSPVAYLWIAAQTASLAGSVLDPAGTPVPGATVTVSAAAGGALPGGPLTATTDAAGGFDIPAVFPAPVQVAAAAPGRGIGPALAVAPIPDPADPAQLVFDAVVVPAAAAPVAPAAPDPAAQLAPTGADVLSGLGPAAAAIAGGLLLLGCAAAVRRRLFR